jgi:transposase
MPASYGYDLRTKVINAIDGGMRKTQASRIFQISRNTIDNWLKKKEETGDYQAKVGYHQGYNPKITDLEKFQQFVEANGNKTQAEMAEVWTEKISDRTIGKALKKIGYTRKKKLTGIEKGMKTKGENFELKSAKKKAHS